MNRFFLTFCLTMVLSLTATAQDAGISPVNVDSTLAANQNPESAPDDAPDDNPKDDNLYIDVEQMPQFPGGPQALFKFLSENVKYPAIAKENRIQGRVICQFIINKDGSITDVEVVRSGGDPSLDKEAVRVLKAMPNWIPCRQQGKPVRVKYTVPVNFRL